MYFFSFSTATGEMNICSDAQHFQRANRKRTAFIAVRFLFSERDSNPDEIPYYGLYISLLCPTVITSITSRLSSISVMTL